METKNKQRISTIIVEDQEPALKGLAKLIEKNFPQLEIVALCNAGEKAIADLNKHKPQLVFLDYNLDTMTAFDVLDRVPHLSFKVIFTTQYDERAIEALNRYNPIYYLMKPIDENLLVEAVNKATQEIERDMAARKEKEIYDMVADLVDLLKPNRFLVIPSKGEKQIVPYNKILYFEADSYSTRVVLESGKVLSVSKTLDEIMEKAPDHFCRVHRSFAVNVNRFETIKYQTSQNRYVVMVPDPREPDGKVIPVGPNYKEEFFNYINQ